MRLVPDGGGYTFSDVSTVRLYLSNLTLGGYGKVGRDEEGNVLLLPNAFEPAIPLDLLDPAYAAITGHHIDGMPFEGYKNKRRYMRSNPQGPRCLFDSSIITSDQGHISTDIRRDKGHYECFAGTHRDGYTLKLRSGLVDAKVLWSVSSCELDRIVVERLCDLAQYDKDMAERVRKVFESLKGQKEDEVSLLNGQIERIQQQIHRLDFLMKNPEIPLDVETAAEYARTLAELRPKLARLIKKQQTTPKLDPGETIANFYFVLAHLPTEFRKQSPSVQKQIMSKLVKQVTINNLAPHLFRLYIVWQDGVATRPDIALLWRGSSVRDVEGWKEEENAVLREHWHSGQQLDVMCLLPMRSWTAMRQQANTLGIVRSKEMKYGRKKVMNVHETIAFKDLEAAMNCAENGEGRDYMSKIIDELAGATAKKNMTPYWPLPLDIVGFKSFVSDEEGRST